MRQEERTGIKGKDVKVEVTEAFKASDGAEAFEVALAEPEALLAVTTTRKDGKPNRR